MNAQSSRGASHLRRALARARAEFRLTGVAIWRGVTGIYNSDDLTHSASIAYYALLSLFPFLLLVVSVLGSFTADEQARQQTLDFVLTYFPTRLEFVSTQMTALQRTQVPLGVMGGLALIWAAHIGFDRALGYGLKYPSGFGDTHLGRIGGKRANS